MVVFSIGTESGRDLWRSDGTAVGTWRLATFTNGPVSAGARAGDRIYFAAATSADGNEVWVTDGSNVSANTHLVQDLQPGPASSDPSQLTAIGNDVYFKAYVGGVARLWRRDGTGTISALSGAAVNISIKCSAGGLVYFKSAASGSPEELWRTDGTPSGTIALLQPSEPLAFEGDCKSVADAVFFPVLSGGTHQLWRSDGTVVGTVATSFSGGSNSMRLLHWTGTHWLIATTELSARFRDQLWATNGALDTRAITTDIAPDRYLRVAAASVGSNIVFTTKISIPNSPETQATFQLWRTDPDGRNTARLTSDVVARQSQEGTISAHGRSTVLQLVR